MSDDKNTDPSNSTANRLKENSLKASGLAYIVGDLSLAAAKWMEDDKLGAGGAALWAVGGATTGFFGNPKTEKQLQLLERRLGHYLKKQNIEIPKNPTTAELTKDGGVIEHIEAFLYARPSEVLNAIYAIGGVLTFHGGWHKKNTMDKVSGALITAGALAGLLIPEKKPDATHPAEGFLAKTWGWAQEKPLRVSGAFYLANNIPMAMGARTKQREGQKSYAFRYLTVATYVFANIMLMMSSKDNLGAKDEQKHQKMLEDLSQTSAQVIAAQPKEIQEALVHNIAGYLSAQKEVKKPANDIAEMLHKKLSSIQPGLPTTGKWQQQPQASSCPSL